MFSFHLLSVSMCFILINVTQATVRTKSEVYAAISSIKPLIETQKIIIKKLESYIEEEEDKLNILSKYSKLYMQETNYSTINTLNPMNAFILIKRTIKDLDVISKHLILNSEYNKNLVVIYPSKDDLIGAAEGFVRIQTTYELNVTELSMGLLKSHYNEKREESLHYFKSMSFDDCYVLGTTLYESGYYSVALGWLLEAYHKLLDNNYENETPYKLVDILENIVFVYIELDECYSAKSFAVNLIKIDHSLNYDLQLQECLEKNKKKNQSINHFDLNEKKEIEKEKQDTCSPTPTCYVRYEKFCRGEMDIAPEVKHRLVPMYFLEYLEVMFCMEVYGAERRDFFTAGSRMKQRIFLSCFQLKCRYFYGYHPFLLLAPFKMEELYLEPDVYLFYDVISDEEIKKVEQASLTKFERAKVSTAAGSIPSKSRISKTAWLDSEDCSVLDKLFDRVTDMTGYDLYFSPAFQIANYGIGGHYEMHFDYFIPNTDGYEKFIKIGNRIATVLIYISDVEQGGATVFTKLGLTMFPIKGAAVVWKNLFPDGQVDPTMAHGACPVLLGDKWGINLWIREHAQELIEPCPLDPKQGMTRNNLEPVQWTRI